MEVTAAIVRLRDIGQPILQAASTRELFPVRFTFRLVLERLVASLNTLVILVESGVLRHNHAIGLICRNILSDVIATGYLIKLSSSEENLYENLYALYHEDLRRTDRIIKLYREANVLSEEEATKYNEKHTMPDSMYKVIKDYVEEYKPDRFPNNTAIIKELLITKKDDSWSKELQRSFDIWTYYSKYEHLGWYAYELTRDLDPVKVESRLRSVLRLTALLQSSCFEMLEEKKALDESMAVYRQLLTTPANALVARE